MAGDVYRQYVWLLDLISRYDGITFREIDERWQASSLNEDGAPLSKRTFHNHIAKIEQIFGIEIGAGVGYKYRIKHSSDIDISNLQQSLLANIQMSNALFSNPKLSGRIWLDGFLAFRYYNPLIEAMERGAVVELRLSGAKVAVVKVEPYLVKQFATEWFLIGRDTVEGGINSYAFSRIIAIRESQDGERFVLPDDFLPKEFLLSPTFGEGANNSNDLYMQCHCNHKHTLRRSVWGTYVPENYSARPVAIYVHGLASGADSSTYVELTRRFPQFNWICEEFGEDLAANVECLNELVSLCEPKLIVGTSMGGLETLYANAPNAVKVVCNPALSLADCIRNTFGLGWHDYLYERRDGVQQFELTEDMCREYEEYIATHPILLGRDNYAMFALNDELLGEKATLEAYKLLEQKGFTVFADPAAQHRFGEGNYEYLKTEVIPNL